MSRSNFFESFERRMLLSTVLETGSNFTAQPHETFAVSATQAVTIDLAVETRSWGTPGATLTVTLTAGQAVSGDVTFYRDDQVIGTAALGANNVASFGHWGAGAYAFRAEYSGDAGHAVSSTHTVTVPKTYLGKAIASRADDGSVRVEYSGYPIKPTGTIYFMSGPSPSEGAVFATATLVDGVAVLNQAPASVPPYIAYAYEGDDNYNPQMYRIDTVPMPFVASRPVTVQITPPSAPVTAGQSAEYRIQLIDSDLGDGEWFAGSIAIEVDGEVVQTVTVYSDGTASVDLALDAGNHAIQVAYQRTGGQVGWGTDPFHASGATGMIAVVVQPTGGVDQPATVTTLSFTGDTNGDGTDEQVIYNRNTRAVWIAMDDGKTVVSLHANPPKDGWRLAGVADFDGDGFADLLWTHDELRKQSIWNLKGRFVTGFSMLNHAPKNNAWVIESVEDQNGDGDTDLLWRNTDTGGAYVWLMRGTTVIGGVIPA